jgi:hypothetical protein
VPQVRFHKVREAKEFLASKIVDQAEREGAPLSDIERKMLFFGCDASFGSIANTIRPITRRKSHNSFKTPTNVFKKKNLAEYEDRRSAIEFLKWKDHYINVMIQAAASSRGFATVVGCSVWCHHGFDMRLANLCWV